MHLKYYKSAILQLKKKNSDIWISIGNILWNPYNLSYFILWTIFNCKLVLQNFLVVSSFPLHRVQWLCAWALILCFHLVVTEKMNWSEVKWSEVAQSCSTLCDPVDCSLPGSSVHGIFQARVLAWVAISFSRGSSWPRDLTPGLPHCRRTLPSEPPGKSIEKII